MLEVWWYDRNVKTGPDCEGIRENINSMLLALRIEDLSKFTTYKKTRSFWVGTIKDNLGELEVALQSFDDSCISKRSRNFLKPTGKHNYCHFLESK